MRRISHFVALGLALATGIVACESTSRESATSPTAPEPSAAMASLEPTGSRPFGTFDGIPFVRHTGVFEGETSRGAFRMPWEIVAPEDPGLGSGTVLLEPPHWGFGPAGRDFILGRGLVFGRGMSYAAVGWGDDGLNVLDPGFGGLLLAGEPVASPGTRPPPPDVVLDEEILIQFAAALTTAPFAVDALGPVDRLYAYGISQTADALLELQRAVETVAAQNPFDLTFLHLALWGSLPAGIRSPLVWDFLDGEFQPISGSGRVIFLESEGDRVVSESEVFRSAAHHPDHRVYEVPGTAHLPTVDNPLDHVAIARALFVAGDEWVRFGVSPPASTLIEEAPAGRMDPVYGVETGIARDADLNAMGGVRMPDLQVGRARFVASDPTTTAVVGPALAVLTGSVVDLTCEPRPGSGSDEPRFRNHGGYVAAYTRQVNELRRGGFLLEADADAMKERAAETRIGSPGSCPG